PRGGLDAPSLGGEDKFGCSLLSSLPRRGLDARGDGVEDRDADFDGIMAGNFGAGAGEDVWGDFGAGVGGDAGAASGGFCGGAGASNNMASQSCGKAIIVTLLGKKLQSFNNIGSSSRHTFSVITFSPSTFG